MLVLTRKVDQTILIGENITVKVLAVTGRHVRIGIEAPKETAVHREEIYNRIKKESAVLSKEKVA